MQKNKMVTRETKISISGLDIKVIRKDIKNIHLGVYPPNGRIRASIPLNTNDETLRLFLISKIFWIRKQQKRFLKQERQTKREYVSGESHYLFGKRYQLNVNKTDKQQRIEFKKKTHIEFYINPTKTIQQKEKIFENFYRNELQKIIPTLIKKWSNIIGVTINEVKIKKMKTKWGTCNKKDKRIWLNLELAKQSLHCIDYIFVHELIHLIEKNHSKRFLEILENVYPRWRERKDEMNQGILGYFEWGCKSNPKLKQILEN